MEERPDFLPPEAPGPEPELGSAPAPAPPPPAPPPPAQPYAPPAQAGWQQPPPDYPPYGWQQPPPPGWGYPQPAQPDNGAAVTGFVLSLISAGLLFVSAGISSLVSVGCSIIGIVYSRMGKKKVESGETTKHAGLAQAGFIIGIIGLVLSVLATLVWILVIVAAVTDDQFRDELEREFENSDSISAVLRIAAAAARLLWA